MLVYFDTSPKGNGIVHTYVTAHMSSSGYHVTNSFEAIRYYMRGHSVGRRPYKIEIKSHQFKTNEFTYFIRT